MSERRNTSGQFEAFVADLMAAYGIRVEIERPGARHVGFDFRVQSATEVTAIVEVRLNQSLKIAFNLWRRTFDQLEGARSRVGTTVAILVTNARLPTTLRPEVPPSIQVWDFDTISFLAGSNADLASRWERISQEGFIHRSEALPDPRPVDIPAFIAASPPPPPAPLAPPREPLQTGADLCARLRAIKPGKGKAAADFETVCAAALRYLFEDDLINWTPQKASHGQLHRYDLIARIASRNDFWNSLIQDHRARYLIFEFKNYASPISQAEVYSTEKYLFPQAMRSTGIIVSRKGGNRNAVRVTQGAFRNEGKLILILDLDQMCEMLDRRDLGEDPSDVLGDAIEDLLVGLER